MYLRSNLGVCRLEGIVDARELQEYGLTIRFRGLWSPNPPLVESSGAGARPRPMPVLGERSRPKRCAGSQRIEDFRVWPRWQRPRVYGNRAPIEAVTLISEAGLEEPPCDHLDYTESIIPL